MHAPALRGDSMSDREFHPGDVAIILSFS